jgi:MATE family multidrug resistance protein
MNNTKENGYSFGKIISLAISLLIFQLTDTLILFTDRFFISLLGDIYLSAGLTGGLSYVTFTTPFISCLGIINTFVSQQYGAGKKTNCSLYTLHGIILSLLFYLMIMTIKPIASYFLFMNHSKELQILEKSYFSILCISSIFSLIQICFLGFFAGTKRARIIVFSNVLGMILNIPLTYILVFGIFSPKLGIQGAAWSTCISKFFALLPLLITYLSKGNSEYKPANLNVNLLLLKTILRYGAPSGMEQFINIFCINFFVQTVASYNAIASSAVSVAFNWDLLSYLPLLGIGSAATTIVGHLIGQRSINNINKSVLHALSISLIFSMTASVFYLFATKTLVNVFIHNIESETFDLAMLFLRFAAIYTIADSIQVTFAGALRGAGDTRWVLLISCSLHTILATTTFIMTKIFAFKPLTIWLIYVSFIIILATAMTIRYTGGQWKKHGIL